MKLVGGMWLPDSDEHFAKTFAVKGRYHQEELIDLAMSYVKDRRLAFDIGAHVGYMTRKMLEYFEWVIAWEPQRENYECLTKNIPAGRASSRPWALGLLHLYGEMSNPMPGNSGAWEFRMGPGSAPCYCLDEEHPGLPPGLVKIDVQGMEGDVLRGGEKTIRAANPVILIEANDENGVSALLESWGARKMGFVRRDQIWAWPDHSPLLEK